MAKKLSREQTEKLIEFVREKPYLYDLKDPGHLDAVRSANAFERAGGIDNETSQPTSMIYTCR